MVSNNHGRLQQLLPTPALPWGRIIQVRAPLPREKQGKVCPLHHIHTGGGGQALDHCGGGDVFLWQS